MAYATRIAAFAMLLALAGCGGGSGGLASLGAGDGPAPVGPQRDGPRGDGPVISTLLKQGDGTFLRTDLEGDTGPSPQSPDGGDSLLDTNTHNPNENDDGDTGLLQTLDNVRLTAIDYVDSFYVSYGVEPGSDLNVREEVYWGYWARHGTGYDARHVGVMLLKDDARNWDNSEQTRALSRTVYPYLEPDQSAPIAADGALTWSGNIFGYKRDYEDLAMQPFKGRIDISVNLENATLDIDSHSFTQGGSLPYIQTAFDHAGIPLGSDGSFGYADGEVADGPPARTTGDFYAGHNLVAGFIDDERSAHQGVGAFVAKRD